LNDLKRYIARFTTFCFEPLFLLFIQYYFLQSPGYNSAIEKEGASTDELSLALYEMTSLPEFLPVLSVIPEVSWT
jgi:hypothetical protein